jgi:hypothetical protein
MPHRLSFILSCTLAILFLGGCEGQLNIDLSATPPEGLNAAVLRINSLTLTNAEGLATTLDFDDQDIDVSKLNRGRVITLLRDKGIAAGDYTSVLVNITAQSQVLDSYIEKSDGGQVSLVLRAGSQALASNTFKVRDEEDTNLTLHLDFRSSLLPGSNAASDRLLTPRIRLIETSQASSISGDVAQNVLTGSACDSTATDAPTPVLYVFEGLNINPDDIDGISPDPISTALVSLASVQADYVASFLPAGDYTLSLTCAAANDDPDLNDSIVFLASQNISLGSGSNATLNFSN